MKIAILATGKSDYFPIFIDKPKCLYHVDGVIQLEKVIKTCSEIIGEENIIVVAGYKYYKIANFLKKYPKVKLKINYDYLKPAIYSYRKAAENENDDIVFLCADESILSKNIKSICDSNKKMSILYHNNYYYYSLGIFKLRKDQLDLLFDDKYLNMKEIQDIYCFANNKKIYDGNFNINSGICLGYIIIDLIRRIGNINKVENPAIYHGEHKDIDFIYYDPSKEYTKDLDTINQTDEYKHNFFIRLYSDYFSRLIRGIIRRVKRYIHE